MITVHDFVFMYSLPENKIPSYFGPGVRVIYDGICIEVKRYDNVQMNYEIVLAILDKIYPNELFRIFNFEFFKDIT